jgi:hypothetical protein
MSHTSDPLVNYRTHSREDRLFTEECVRLCALGVALGYLLALALRLISHKWGNHSAGAPCIDFIWIWLSGKLASSATPIEVYNHASFLGAKAASLGPSDCVLGNFDNPPTLLFLTYPFGFLPYWIAFAAWMAATLALYLAAVYAIVPRPTAVIVALTPFPVFFNVLLGHNGFLTAGLVGLALVFAEGWPWLSGIFLGVLTYKPQFGLLFPFAFIASRNWRALLSAALASLILAAAAAIAFGYQTWPAFVAALADRASNLSGSVALNVALVSIFGTLRTLGTAPSAAWAVQLAVSALGATIVCALWARPIPYSLKAAALAIGAVLAAPHAIGYDACILTIGVAFLVKDGLARGFLPRERGIVFGCWAGLFLLTGPVPAIICVVLLFLVVRRAVRYPAGSSRAKPALPEPALAGNRDAPLKITV